MESHLGEGKQVEMSQGYVEEDTKLREYNEIDDSNAVGNGNFPWNWAQRYCR